MKRTEVKIDNYTGEELDERFQRIESAIEKLTLPSKPFHLLTKKETAALFQVTERTIHTWSKLGIIKAYMIGNKVFYKRDDIESALGTLHQRKAG